MNIVLVIVQSILILWFVYLLVRAIQLAKQAQIVLNETKKLEAEARELAETVKRQLSRIKGRWEIDS